MGISLLATVSARKTAGKLYRQHTQEGETCLDYRARKPIACGRHTTLLVTFVEFLPS